MKRLSNKGFSLIESLIIVAIVGIIAITLPHVCEASGWGSNKEAKSTTMKQARQIETIISEASRQVGMPRITNFQQLKIMKMIYETCDDANLICYAYLKADYSGKPVFLTKCIGYGVPFSAQFTNPQRIVDLEQEGGVKQKFDDNGEVQVVAQADPNGLYMPTSSSATWLLVPSATGKPKLAYIEPELMVFPFKLAQ